MPSMRPSSKARPRCHVCEMPVDPGIARRLICRGKTYCFMSEPHKQRFAEDPRKFLYAADGRKPYDENKIVKAHVHCG
jgi:YHS domain-containing protein